MTLKYMRQKKYVFEYKSPSSKTDIDLGIKQDISIICFSK